MTPDLHSILDTFVQNVQNQSKIEWIAAVTSFVCVWLTVRNNIWNWFWGFIGVVLYGVIFWNYQNYANCALQILYFVPIQFIGWYVWLRSGPNKSDDLPVTVLSWPARLAWIAATVVLTGFLWWGLCALPSANFAWLADLLGKPELRSLKIAPDPLPFGDALTTAMSIVAQYLQVRKNVENWWLWIAADVVYFLYVFPVQHFYLTTLLYFVFTILAIKGAVDWRRILREQAEAARQAAAGEAAEPVEVEQTEPVRPYA